MPQCFCADFGVNHNFQELKSLLGFSTIISFIIAWQYSQFQIFQWWSKNDTSIMIYRIKHQFPWIMLYIGPRRTGWSFITYYKPIWRIQWLWSVHGSPLMYHNIMYPLSLCGNQKNSGWKNDIVQGKKEPGVEHKTNTAC